MTDKQKSDLLIDVAKDIYVKGGVYDEQMADNAIKAAAIFVEKVGKLRKSGSYYDL